MSSRWLKSLFHFFGEMLPHCTTIIIYLFNWIWLYLYQICSTNLKVGFSLFVYPSLLFLVMAPCSQTSAINSVDMILFLTVLVRSMKIIKHKTSSLAPLGLHYGEHCYCGSCRPEDSFSNTVHHQGLLSCIDLQTQCSVVRRKQLSLLPREQTEDVWNVTKETNTAEK